jgi:hypothetical protein
MAKGRVVVSWEFPAGYFFKCVLKRLRDQGRSPSEVVGQFKWLLPDYQLVFDTERADRGLPRVLVNDNMLKQRADKGSRVGYESEWPDRHAACCVYWLLAGLVVKANVPLGLADLQGILAPVSRADTAPDAAAPPAINRPQALFPFRKYLYGDEDDLSEEILRDLEYFDAIQNAFTVPPLPDGSGESPEAWLKRLSHGVAYGALAPADREYLHLWRDTTKSFYDLERKSGRRRR